MCPEFHQPGLPGLSIPYHNLKLKAYKNMALECLSTIRVTYYDVDTVDGEFALNAIGAQFRWPRYKGVRANFNPRGEGNGIGNHVVGDCGLEDVSPQRAVGTN